METYFSRNASFRLVKTDFLASRNHKLFFRLLEKYFLTNPSFQLLEKDFFLLVETHFLASGNIFFHCLRYFSRNSSSWLVETHFSVQKKKYCFLPRTYFPASGKHLTYREAYLKLLSLLLEMISFNFSNISGNLSSFFGLAETYS